MDKNSGKINPEEENFLRDLYKQNYLRIYNYIKIYISNATIAKDITADVFVLACEKVGIVKNHPTPVAWLYTVAKNKLNDFHHRLDNEQELFYITDCENFSSNNDSAYSLKELEVTIYGGLTPQEYDRYLRYFIWGQTLGEIASHEGVTKANMAVRLSRLRSKIKELLSL